MFFSLRKVDFHLFLDRVIPRDGSVPYIDFSTEKGATPFERSHTCLRIGQITLEVSIK